MHGVVNTVQADVLHQVVKAWGSGQASHDQWATSNKAQQAQKHDGPISWRSWGTAILGRQTITTKMMIMMQ